MKNVSLAKLTNKVSIKSDTHRKRYLNIFIVIFGAQFLMSQVYQAVCIFFTFIDDYSKKVWIRFLRSKYEILENFS